jgi:NAD(P)-dependent dehydrogenase (short-subunit alcohol dehydrogenase family)
MNGRWLWRRKVKKQHSAEVFDRALDVTDAVAVRQFVEAVVAKFGAADICVTNAEAARQGLSGCECGGLAQSGRS